LESPSFSKAFFVGFASFQRVTRDARAIFSFPNILRRYARRNTVFVPAGLARSSEGFDFKTSTSLVFPQSKRTRAFSPSGTVRLWDVKTGAETARLELDMRIGCLAAQPSGGLVAGGHSERLHWLEIVD
jgi:hypothetical protein